MLPSPASSLSFPSPLERREADPYARCDRQRPACNESHEPAQERPEPVATCAFIEEERRRGDPTGLLYALGPRERESRSGWRSGWRRWSTISTWTVPLSRRGQRWERSAAKPRRAFAAAAANPSISPQARGAVAAGNPFRRQGRGAGGVGAPLPALRNARRRQRRALRWVTLSPWRSAVTLRQCTRASRIMKLTRVGETPSSWRCPSVARRAGGTSRRRSGCAWAAR